MEKRKPKNQLFSWAGGVTLAALLLASVAVVATEPYDPPVADAGCNALLYPNCAIPTEYDLLMLVFQHPTQYAPPPPRPPTPQEIIQQTLSHGHLQTPPPRTCTPIVTYVYGVLVTTVVCN